MEKGNDPQYIPQLMLGRIFYVNAETLQWECTEHLAISRLKRAAMMGDMGDVERADYFTLIDAS